MSSPPSYAASPPPISVITETFVLTWVDKYLALAAICTVIILYLIAFSYYKTRNLNESEPANAAAGAFPAVRERKIVQIDASVFSYRELADGGDNNECVICLSEFKEGQKCRMIKKCGHVFHRSCIDRWLKVEQHCPLCRSCICIVVHP